MTELIVGTAQFGDEYGVLNTAGALTDKDLESMARLALKSGVRHFDTSPFYGNAEERIQRLVAPLGNVSVITKFALPANGVAVSEALVAERLEILSPIALAGLMFHRVQDLRDDRVHAAWAILKQARDDRKIGMIGASIYDPADLEVALTNLPELDLLQIPGNVVDRRLLSHPLLEKFHKTGGTVHVRSAYLQGLLLSQPSELPPEFQDLTPVLENLRHTSAKHNLTIPSLLLGYLKQHPNVDGVVVGALSKEELQETINAWEHAVDVDMQLPSVSKQLLDPRLWQRN